MPVNISLMPVEDRVATIEQSQSLGRSLRVRFRGTLTDLPIKRVPLDLPIYRMANTRTIVRQKDFIANNSLSDDFFGNGQEDPTAQQAQHTILVDLARAPRANIYSALEEQAEQSEPLIITVKGVTLNGNRRLSAMRDLYDRDPGRFARFSHAEVALLPSDANEDDLTALETALQIARDLRLEYGWVEEGLGLRRQVDQLGWSLATASGYWDETETELNARLSQLTVAEQYLDYLDQSGKYSEVSAHEQAFSTLHDRQVRRTAATPSLLESERLVLFAVISQPDVIDRRVYDYAVAIEEVAERVRERVSASVDLNSTQESNSDDPLAALPDAPDEVPPPVIDYLRDHANSTTVATFAVEARAEIERERRAGRRAGEYLRSATQANSAIAGMALAHADPSTVGPAVVQLVASLQNAVSRLEEALEAHPSAESQIDRNVIADVIERLGRV